MVYIYIYIYIYEDHSVNIVHLKKGNVIVRDFFPEVETLHCLYYSNNYFNLANTFVLCI